MSTSILQYAETVAGSRVLLTVPVVDPSLYHTVLDEGMSAPPATKDADYTLVNGVGTPTYYLRFKINSDDVPESMETVSCIQVSFHHVGTGYNDIPAAYFRLYAGTPLALIEEKFINLVTTPSSHKDVAVLFSGLAMSRADYITHEIEIEYATAAMGEPEEPLPWELWVD